MSQTEIYVFQIIISWTFSIIIWGSQMYTNNAYLNNSTIDRKDKSKPLVVTMCGTYKLYTHPKLPTWRPRGRVDFQLIFIAASFSFWQRWGRNDCSCWSYGFIPPKRTPEIWILCQRPDGGLLGSFYRKQCHQSAPFLWIDKW